MGARELDAALRGVERVVVDSSTLIAFHSPGEAAHSLADRLLRRIESGSDDLRGYYAMVSAVELLVRPIRTGQERVTFMRCEVALVASLAVGDQPVQLPLAFMLGLLVLHYLLSNLVRML